MILLFASAFVSADAQKPKAKNRAAKNTIQQKADDWQEHKQPDFTVKFPQNPAETNDVFQLADQSVRYSAADAKGIVYSIDRLEFGKDFWQAFEDFEREKTIYDNLEMQQDALGATLLFRTEISQQSVSGRTAYFKLPEKNGEAFDLLQNTFKKDDRVYVVRVLMPVKTLRSETNEYKDFPASVKDFLASFRFLPEVNESDAFPPPAPPKPATTPKDNL